MSSHPRTMPTRPGLYGAEVLHSTRLAPSFQRVTLTGPELARFEFAGRDQWFRLFLPRTSDQHLVLPTVTGREWWQSYLAIPERHRPHVSNYTVADLRRGPAGVELDVDVVLHWEASGEMAGTVARWASTVEPGHRVALLDQGVLFDPPADASELVLVGDETALPGLRGIVRDVPSKTPGRVLVEVPSAGDVEGWAAPDGLEVTWLPRQDPGEQPGERALAALTAGPRPHPRAYALVVGEAGLATGGRRWLVRSGLAKERICFSGYYKRPAHGPRALVGSRQGRSEA